MFKLQCFLVLVLLFINYKINNSLYLPEKNNLTTHRMEINTNEKNDKQNINNMQDLSDEKDDQNVSPESNPTTYVIPEIDTPVVFKCAEEGDKRVVYAWILPNGKKIYPKDKTLLTTISHDKKHLRSESVFYTANNSNDKIVMDHRAISYNKYEMKIFLVKHDMNGLYTCLFNENNAKSDSLAVMQAHRSFFIPYVVSPISLLESVTLSLGISAVFCVMCAAILFIDRYSARRKKDEEFQDISYKGHNGRLSVSSTDQLPNSASSIRRKTLVQQPTELWDTNEEAEKVKYFGRKFSTIGFDEILPPCIEKSEKSSAQPSGSSTPPHFNFNETWADDNSTENDNPKI